MIQQERVMNVHALLGEIGTFLDGAPAKKTGQVDWERFSENKKRAQDSLDSLRGLFGFHHATKRVCKDGRPEEKPEGLTMSLVCKDGRPKDKPGDLTC